MDACWREAGSGPPVLLLTGLGLSGDFYAPLAAPFAAAGLRLVVVDPPGFGGTPGPLLGNNVPELAAFYAAAAAALQLGPAVWAGHSIGAQVALAAAAAHPAAVRALALLAPSGGPGRLLRLRQLGALGLTAFRVSPRLVGTVLGEYAGNNPVRVTGTWLKAARDRPVEHAHGVRAPTLVLLGGRDPVPGRQFLDRLRTALPQSRWQTVAAGTHALPREAPGEVTAALQDFLSDLPAA